MNAEHQTYESHPTPEAVQALAQFKRHFKAAERSAIEWRVCKHLRSTCSLPVRRYYVTMLVAYVGGRALRGYTIGRDGSLLTHRDPMGLIPWTNDQ